MGKKRPNSVSATAGPAKRPKLSSTKCSSSELLTDDFPRGGKLSRKRKTAAISVEPTTPHTKRRVDTLIPKTLTAGTLVLGAVQEISDLEVTVSLPNNMCGVVAISNVSDPMTEDVEEEVGDGEREATSSLRRLFFTGQLVVCCVLNEVEKRRGEKRKARVELTVNPRIVNNHLSAQNITSGMVFSGWVRSVEDHGYIIDFGVAGKTGFLLKKNASQFIEICNTGEPLVRGQVMRCKVLSAVDARSVPVSVNPDVVGGALVGGDSLIQLHALQPGMLVNTVVKEVLSNGVVVTFLGGFEGSVGLRHLPSWDSPLDSLPPKKKVKGRLLWVDVEGKRFGVSLRKSLVEEQSIGFTGLEFGDKFEDAEIVRVYPDSSLLLDLGSGYMGYSPLPLVYDEKQDKLSHEHRIGSQHSCRIVHFNLIDGVAIVSLQPSILSRRYMRYADIVVGDILEATVERHSKLGVVLLIQGNIRGLCPTPHLTDSLSKNLWKKYEVGKVVKCRVLRVDVAERRVLLTCKKSFLHCGEDEVADFSELQPDQILTGFIKKIMSYGCFVEFPHGLIGLAPNRFLRDEFTWDPAQFFQQGQTVLARVLEINEDKRRFLVSLRPSDVYLNTTTSSMKKETRRVKGDQKPPSIAAPTTLLRGSKEVPEKPPYMDVQPGDIIGVIVRAVKTAYLSVKYHLWQGRVHCCLATENPCPGHTPFGTIHPGDVVKARVLGIRKKEIKHLASKKGASLNTLELTTMESLLDPSCAEVDASHLLRGRFTAGEELFGVVNEITDQGVSLHLSPKAMGFVPLMLVHKDPKVLCNLRRHFAEGEAVKCTVVSGRKKNSKHIVSLIGAVTAPCVGSVLDCLVHEVTPLCLIVRVPWGVGFGRVDITDISDHYTDNPLETFRDNKDIWRCCVVSMSGDKMDLSMRASRVHGNTPLGDSLDQEVCSLEDLPEGTVVRGYIKAVTNVGVFVRLGRGIDGRVQIKHLTDGFVKNYKEQFAVGQLVKAKVIEVNPVRHQVELSLRLSHTDPTAAKRERRKADKERARGGGTETKAAASSDEESDRDSSCEEEEEEEMEEGESERPTLQLSGWSGFVWEREERKEEHTSSDGEHKDNQQETSSKKSRRQKKAAKKAEEEQLYLTESALLETSRAPENVEDFERLVVSHPNSSALWVQYMAFLLQTAEVDRARVVGERALQSISFREEDEKLNVWVALLNLENLYGSQESLVKVFQTALHQNDPLEVFRRLAAIYQESNKMALAEQLYQTMTRQFRSELSVWTDFGQFLMKQGKVDTARSVLQRCLKALTIKQQHVEAISKFAQWEFQYGDKGRGGTMFESLITSYPRRTDLWCVYSDVLVKAGQLDKAREVLERAIHLKLSAKKMKLMFKRYLNFERKHGSPASIEAVKDKARTYVEREEHGN